MEPGMRENFNIKFIITFLNFFTEYACLDLEQFEFWLIIRRVEGLIQRFSVELEVRYWIRFFVEQILGFILMHLKRRVKIRNLTRDLSIHLHSDLHS